MTIKTQERDDYLQYGRREDALHQETRKHGLGESRGCELRQRVGEIAYIFVDDEKILEVNRQYLGHDYYTDIITFDYCEGDLISGDLFISLDTVRTNAEQVGATYEEELHRVIIHGILHLCGINDKGSGEREIMEAAEDKALALRSSLGQ